MILLCIKILLFLTGVIILINIPVFLWAIYEYVFLPSNNGHWASSKILYPEKSNGKPSLVFIHGFNGSPFDYKILAIKCKEHGFRVLIPEVPGQGNRYFSYLRGRYKYDDYVEWLERIVIQETKQTGTKPYAVGFSMGGTLATIIAGKGLIDSMVLISPFYGLTSSHFNRVIRYLRWIIPVVPKQKIGMIHDPVAYKTYIPGSMLVSLHAFMQLQNLANSAICIIKSIDIPTRVIASPNDTVASYKKTLKFFSGNKDVDIHVYEHGDHILLYDYDRNLIIEDVIRFLLNTVIN